MCKVQFTALRCSIDQVIYTKFNKSYFSYNNQNSPVIIFNFLQPNINHLYGLGSSLKKKCFFPPHSMATLKQQHQHCKKICSEILTASVKTPSILCAMHTTSLFHFFLKNSSKPSCIIFNWAISRTK